MTEETEEGSAASRSVAGAPGHLLNPGRPPHSYAAGALALLRAAKLLRSFCSLGGITAMQ
ncbi:hypothetical protein FHY02_002054 [Sphingomonas sp. BK069]|nr:hypothetical protein [Sphingomonas sp. BK069]